ncbi:MAG: DNA recombination protein RmuC [Chloroflexota bacterium]|nr:DNA recombination protein RmuC [Chloroflexota bacterium]
MTQAALGATVALLLFCLCLLLSLWYLQRIVGRVAGVEQHQRDVSQGMAALGAGVAHTGAVAEGLADATAVIRRDLSRANNDLVALQTYAHARQDLERRTAESVRRLETIIAGTHSKGVAGENILELALSKLPAEWQVRDYRIGNKAVEFGLRLPNNLILPIDSKWPASALLDRFAACEDAAERLRLKGQIEAVVLQKAREVRKYVDPSLTVGFGVAAVPDAVYDLCWGVQSHAFQSNVVLVSYSLFIPYLLLVFQTVLKTSQQVDVQQLEAALRSAQESVGQAQEELEGRYARALIMLSNSRDDLSAHLSRARRSLSGIERLETAADPPPPPSVRPYATVGE